MGSRQMESDLPTAGGEGEPDSIQWRLQVTDPSLLSAPSNRRCLSPKEDRVIALLYDYGWQNYDVAADLHVNESRVSQIKQRAISKLRLQLEPIPARRAA